jgi:FK506-binding nuclear protein
VKPAEKEKQEKKEKKQDKKAKTVAKESKELPGGLKVQDATVGTGPQAKKGDKLLMRYVGKLQDGKVFDKNTKGKPVSPSATVIHRYLIFLCSSVSI